MALSYSAVNKAVMVFMFISPEIKTSNIELRDEANQYEENKILGIGPKDDGGWENLFINVKNVKRDQLNLWQIGKNRVGNSNNVKEVQPGITRFYFF